MTPRFSPQREILDYYELGQEAERLETPFSHWEEVRTLDLLDRFLPRTPAVVLDIGGTAGAYTFPLAEQGYLVDLIDPVPLHLEPARRRAAMRKRFQPRTGNGRCASGRSALSLDRSE